MPFVVYDDTDTVREVNGGRREPIPPGWREEVLSDTHPDVVAFLNPPSSAPETTPINANDLARILMSPGVVLPITQAVIDQAKKDRP